MRLRMEALLAPLSGLIWPDGQNKPAKISGEHQGRTNKSPVQKITGRFANYAC
jgi:hypothetical protein